MCISFLLSRDVGVVVWTELIPLMKVLFVTHLRKSMHSYIVIALQTDRTQLIQYIHAHTHT